MNSSETNALSSVQSGIAMEVDAATQPVSYLSLKYGQASKTGKRSRGEIYYRILTDSERQALYLAIVGNDGGGYYSKEVVPMDKIEQCIQGVNPNAVISSKRFQQAFVGQSVNNAGFLAAILRAEQLLMPAEGLAHQYTLQSGWDDWKQALLATSDKAEHFQPELPKPRGGRKALKIATDQQSESVQQPDDAELPLLQENAEAADITDQSDEDVATEPDKLKSKKRHEKRQHPSMNEA